MATLEKIRQRKKILALVIGAALLAFIIEEGVRALGLIGSTTTIAKVGSEKIEIQDFMNRMQLVNADEQNNDQRVDGAVRQQQVLDEMINEKMLEQVYEKLGIEVSSDEITQLMTGKNPAPAVMQFAQQAGAQTPAEIYDFITNPGKHGVQKEQVAELKMQWDRLTDDIYKQYRFAKLQDLMAGCMQANDLDRAMMAEEENVTNVVNFAKVEYNTLPDDKYPVSDEEIKAQWEKLKPMFKKEEQYRLIHYIAVNIEPNAEDIAAANKIADAAYNALLKGRGVDSVRVLGTVHVDTAKAALSDMPVKVRDMFASAEVGTVRRDTTAGPARHVMYKLMNKEMSLDSVMMSYVIVQGDAKMQKEVLDKLNGGKTLDELKKSYPQKVEGKLKEWQRVVSAPDSTKVKMASTDKYFVYASGAQGATLVKIDEKKPMKMFYTMATVSYDAYASTKTSDGLHDKLQDYLNKNKTAKEFAENAAKAGFNAVEMVVSANTPQLGIDQFQGGIKDTRKAIKWAFEKSSKPGTVSPIFSDNSDVLVAAAVDEIYDGDYMPYTYGPSKEMLTNLVRNEKKGDDLIKKYKGKANDLNGYAQLMGVSVDTANVVFASGDPKIEQKIIGRICGSKQGVCQGPVKGDRAVYVYQIVKQEKSERQPSKEELDRSYAQRRGSRIYASPRYINQVLTKTFKPKKNTIKFY